jgi:NAD(P)-dependent dehydrogenase (short-subunit alcohol dehydrogenase family)
MVELKLKGKIALVTGASRGIGASVVHMLAAQGADIAINYHSKGSRAENVATDVRAVGRHALLIQGDLTNPDDTAAMIESVRVEYGKLDLLVLNASGGLEKDKPADYAMQLNLTAQVRLVEMALPLIPRGGRMILLRATWRTSIGRDPFLVLMNRWRLASMPVNSHYVHARRSSRKEGSRSLLSAVI